MLNISVRGSAQDNTTNPLAFATIILKKDSVLKKITTAGKLGNYVFKELSPDNYNLLCSYLSYKSKRINIKLVQDTLINIQLMNIATNLNEIIVTEKNK